jgi:hypothetical protein
MTSSNIEKMVQDGTRPRPQIQKSVILVMMQMIYNDFTQRMNLKLFECIFHRKARIFTLSLDGGQWTVDG